MDFIAMDVNCDFMLFQYQLCSVSCGTTQWDSTVRLENLTVFRHVCKIVKSDY
jgi:hypothetical protein